MLVFVVVAVVSLTACTGTADTDSPSSEPAARAIVVLPPTDGIFDYQLGGPYEHLELDGGEVSPTVVARDATAEPLLGAYNICYVNGFQTQPGDSRLWLDRAELVLQDPAGAFVVDPDWPDEFILDPSTAAQRSGILAVIGPVIDGCADSGFDAIEIDNLDTWTRFSAIPESGAHALASAYVERAHGAGLAIAQKNAAGAAGVARETLGFDFAVTEECAAWDECGAYTDAYGDHVLQIEYRDALGDAGLTFDAVCEHPDRAPLTILRDRELVARDSPGYVYERC